MHLPSMPPFPKSLQFLLRQPKAFLTPRGVILSIRLASSSMNPQHSSSPSSVKNEDLRSRVSIPEGEDTDAILSKLGILLVRSTGGDDVPPAPVWTLTEGGTGVERGFRFRTFGRTWAFMNVIAEHCKKQKHHPEWSNVYNSTHILWTTHNPAGLTIKDVEMATFCDEQAALHDELTGDAVGTAPSCHGPSDGASKS